MRIFGKGGHAILGICSLLIVGCAAYDGGSAGPLGASTAAIASPAQAELTYASQWADYTPTQMAKGREIYLAACVSCHGRNLEGATGFRLSDTQWVHGSSFEQVAHSILKGFPEKGMPGLEGVYPQEDINALTAYVLSQQGGWLNHQYAIWALPNGSGTFDPAWLDEPPIDQGAMAQPIPTFVKPEISEYAMRVSGDVLIPAGEPAFIYAQGSRLPLTVELNGQKLTQTEWVAGALYAVPAGQHHLSLTYTTIGSAPRNKGRMLQIFVTDAGAKVRKFALTMGAQRALEKATIKELATDRPRVIRRRVVNLPYKSISVGFPEEYNFSFNPVSCSIVGVWQGEFLDIGPNFIDRGNFGAIPLGEMRFKAPEAIGLGGSAETACDYDRMTQETRDAPPRFHFRRAGVGYTLSGQVGLYGLELEVRRDEAQARPVIVAMPEGLTGVSLDQSVNDVARIVIE